MSTTLPDDEKITLRKQRKVLAKERKNAVVKALHSQPLRNIDTEGLSYLQKSLGISSNPQTVDTLDAVFVAIDFEYSHFSAKTGRIRLREVGISTLDTRDIRYKDPKKALSSKHFRTVLDTKDFLFGTSVEVEQDKLVGLLKDLLLPENNNKAPRKFILVGHGFSFEVQVLRGLGINLAWAPMVENILDTHYLGLEIFGQDFSLSRLTRKLGIGGSHFHNAGNDANFSLRAMLLLATHNLSEAESSQQSKIEIYEKITRC